MSKAFGSGVSARFRVWSCSWSCSWSCARSWPAACALLLSSACQSERAAPPEPARAASEPAPGPRPAPAAARAEAPPAQRAPTRAEVEFAGSVQVPAEARGVLRVWVCDAPCFHRTSLSVAVVSPAATGAFGGEVFVPQSSTLWFCAGVVSAAGTIEWRGSALEPFLAEGPGERRPPKLQISLSKGDPVPPPRPLDEPM